MAWKWRKKRRGGGCKVLQHFLPPYLSFSPDKQLWEETKSNEWSFEESLEQSRPLWLWWRCMFAPKSIEPQVPLSALLLRPSLIEFRKFQRRRPWESWTVLLRAIGDVFWDESCNRTEQSGRAEHSWSSHLNPAHSLYGGKLTTGASQPTSEDVMTSPDARTTISKAMITWWHSACSKLLLLNIPGWTFLDTNVQRKLSTPQKKSEKLAWIFDNSLLYCPTCVFLHFYV